MEKLWTMAEVAQYLGIQEVDVEQLVQQGRLTGYKLGGQFLRFRPDQVQALKGVMPSHPAVERRAATRRSSWVSHARDVVYFYDFYLVSAGLLAVLVLYLIAS